jgi:hypothetical protein
MVTRAQKQALWAPWIKNLAVMLKPHLAEKMHQEESGLWHPEPPAHTKLLHIMLHQENRKAPALPDASSKPAWETSSRPTGEQQESCGIPTATPRVNQHSPLGKLTLPPSKKKKKPWINKELKRNRQQKGQNALGAPEEGEEQELISPTTFSKQRL